MLLLSQTLNRCLRGGLCKCRCLRKEPQIDQYINYCINTHAVYIM